MIYTLDDVLNANLIQDSDQKAALIRLAVYRGCFEEFSKNQLPPIDVANALLHKPIFETLNEGVQWWLDVTQKNWLRSTFFKEEIGKDRDPTITLARWEASHDSLRKADDIEILAIFKQLGLVDTIAWPDIDICDVLIQGDMEQNVVERINFLANFTGRLFYLTNPRGLSNNEPSLAPILASWFNRSDAVSIIQAVLDANKDMKLSDKHWLKNLNGLKDDILLALGEVNWPYEKGRYYQNPEIFDAAVKKEPGRHSLAGWPSASDMVEYLFESKRILTGQFQQVEFIPVYSIRPTRAATTEDILEDWYSRYGRHLEASHQLVVVSNNSIGLHSLPFVNSIVRETISRLGFHAEQLVKHMVVVGPGDDQINITRAFDVLARMFYAKHTGLLKSKETPLSSTKGTTMFGIDVSAASAAISVVASDEKRLTK